MLRRRLQVAFVCALLLAGLLMMSGCHHPYFCDNGKTIEARYQLGGERVVIDVDDGVIHPSQDSRGHRGKVRR